MVVNSHYSQEFLGCGVRRADLKNLLGPPLGVGVFCATPLLKPIRGHHRPTTGETPGLVGEDAEEGATGIPLSSLGGHLAAPGPEANVPGADMQEAEVWEPGVGVWGVDPVSSLPSDPMTQALAMSPRSS